MKVSLTIAKVVLAKQGRETTHNIVASEVVIDKVKASKRKG